MQSVLVILDGWFGQANLHVKASNLHLEVDGQQGSVPVVGDVHQVVVAVGCAPATHKPDRLKSRFAEQGTAEGDVLAVAAVNVLREALEGGVVHEHPIDAVCVAMEEPHLRGNPIIRGRFMDILQFSKGHEQWHSLYATLGCPLPKEQ